MCVFVRRQSVDEQDVTVCCRRALRLARAMGRGGGGGLDGVSLMLALLLALLKCARVSEFPTMFAFRRAQRCGQSSTSLPFDYSRENSDTVS